MPDNCQSRSDSDYPSPVRVGEPVGIPARWGSPMGRGINLLSARFVDTTKDEGRHSDGGGLYLLVRKRGDGIEKLWLFRYKRGGRGASKETSISLGPSRDVTLAEARVKAGQCRAALQRGADPKTEFTKPDIPTFGAVADQLIADVGKGFRNEKTRAAWNLTLGDAYCSKLRKLRIDQIGVAEVLEALKPVWLTRPETARRMRERLERVFDVAEAAGYREGKNPARWKGHLKIMLPLQPAGKNHHRALPYEKIPEFMPRLKALDSISALALEWTILTAARTAETLGAPRSEIDREAKVWVVPAERMKENREHRVPLCDRCIEIFDEMEKFSKNWLFPARDPREHMSGMSMAQCLKRLDVDATVHGFRSTFRDWAGDCTSFPREMAEAALAHLVGDEAERAYRRSDALARRRKLMVAWEGYCMGKISGNVTAFRRAK